MKNKVVILDRDGVINEDSDNFIKSADEWIPIEGSLEAISRLKKAGFIVAVATNQSGLARKLFDQHALQAMHDKMNGLLAQQGASVDSIVFCPHGPDDNCSCRKPNPGMLLQICKQFDIKPGDTLFVGDTFTDMQAASMAGCRPVLVKTGKGLKTLDKHGSIDGVTVYDSLSHFVSDFLKGSNEKR